MANFGRSLQLVKESFEVLKKDKEMMLFPLISGSLILSLLLFFIVPLIQEGANAIPVHAYPIVFVYYIVSYFIAIFFNTGLMTCAYIRLNGGNPRFKDGFENAEKHIGKIFMWAVLSATIGIILRILGNISKDLGKTLGSVFDIAWSLLAFFVVPVMIFENMSVPDSIKKSAYLSKRTWGENIVAQASMGLVFLILSAVGTVLGIIGIFALIPIAVTATTSAAFSLFFSVFALVAVYLVVLLIINSSLDGIFATALYIYATTGRVPLPYNPEIIKNAFRSENPTRNTP